MSENFSTNMDLSCIVIAIFVICKQVFSVTIKPKPCFSNRHETGTCMFVWECIQSEGRHLGTCTDGFLIGTCCLPKRKNWVNNTTSVPPVSRTSPSPNVTASIYGSFNHVYSYHQATSRPYLSSSQVNPNNTGAQKPYPVNWRPPYYGTPYLYPSLNKRPYSECGISYVPKSKVVGGTNARFGAWPWQVSVRKLRGSYGFASSHRCGGVILNERWIATAAHCVEDLHPIQMRIRVGEHDFGSTSEPFPDEERNVQKKVMYPGYNVFTYENDLSLLKLRDSISFQPHISPICLPLYDADLTGMNAVITGWGRLREGGMLPSVLQQATVPIMSNDKCREMFHNAGKLELVPESFLCAGFTDGGIDSCQGDSGGPLQVLGDDGKWFLAGIISWGIGCAQPNMPGVCVRISKYKDWILRTIAT